MTAPPISPRVMKGALVGTDVFNPLASVVVFQYNPDSMTRTLSAQTAGGGANTSQGEAMRIKGPPEETIRFEVEIDATDQLEQADATAASMGIYPALSSLEMLLYPKSALVIAREVLLQLGIIEVVQPEAPLTLLIWGPNRVLPVRLSEFSIVEEAFDQALNPIRAKVSLTVQVLNYNHLGLPSAGGALFMAHQVIKEVMATIGGANALSGSGGASISGILGG